MAGWLEGNATIQGLGNVKVSSVIPSGFSSTNFGSQGSIRFSVPALTNTTPQTSVVGYTANAAAISSNGSSWSTPVSFPTPVNTFNANDPNLLVGGGTNGAIIIGNITTVANNMPFSTAQLNTSNTSISSNITGISTGVSNGNPVVVVTTENNYVCTIPGSMLTGSISAGSYCSQAAPPPPAGTPTPTRPVTIPPPPPRPNYSTYTVTLGSTGTVISSGTIDAANPTVGGWESFTPPTASSTQPLRDLSYNAYTQQYTAVGDSGQVYNSNDGRSWAADTQASEQLPQNVNWGSITSNDGVDTIVGSAVGSAVSYVAKRFGGPIGLALGWAYDIYSGLETAQAIYTQGKELIGGTTPPDDPLGTSDVAYQLEPSYQQQFWKDGTLYSVRNSFTRFTKTQVMSYSPENLLNAATDGFGPGWSLLTWADLNQSWDFMLDSVGSSINGVLPYESADGVPVNNADAYLGWVSNTGQLIGYLGGNPSAINQTAVAKLPGATVNGVAQEQDILGLYNTTDTSTLYPVLLKYSLGRHTQASGGISEIVKKNTNELYRSHIFTLATSGTFSVTEAGTIPAETAYAHMLAVGGGGGAGTGGGGGGGVYDAPNQPLVQGQFSLTIGSGGISQDGGNTVLGFPDGSRTLYALGGGAGGQTPGVLPRLSSNIPDSCYGVSGGSGGGGAGAYGYEPSARTEFENGNFANGLFGWAVLNQEIFPGDSILGYPFSSSTQYDQNGGFQPGFFGGFSTSTGTNGLTLSLGTSRINIKGGSVYGPAVYSTSPVVAGVGDEISFNWLAAAGSDAYQAQGYLITSTGQKQTIFDVKGTTVSGQQGGLASVTVSTPGDYYFVFVSGTWDSTRGNLLGGSLIISNIQILRASPVNPNNANAGPSLRALAVAGGESTVNQGSSGGSYPGFTGTTANYFSETLDGDYIFSTNAGGGGGGAGGPGDDAGSIGTTINGGNGGPPTEVIIGDTQYFVGAGGGGYPGGTSGATGYGNTYGTGGTVGNSSSASSGLIGFEYRVF